MSPAAARSTVAVGGRRLTLSNLDKVLYPVPGFTKGQVIDYYARIAPVMVPHLEGRPTTLKRYPDGVQNQSFYEKNCPGHRPPWVPTASFWSRHANRTINFCLVEEVATLVWLANLAALELHPSLSRAEHWERPTLLVFDLDPGPPADVVACCEVALLVRELLEGLGLTSVVKTSGSKGLQLYVPLNHPSVGYDDTKLFARAVAQHLERTRPGLVVSNMAKDVRAGKVFIDWSQNDESKTTVGVYSIRAREHPTVSTPVTWEEVESADPDRLRFEGGDVLDRVARLGDLFAPALEVSQALPRIG